MECTQAEAFEQYIRDLRVVRSISRPSFPEGKAPAAVLEEIQTNALRCNTLMRQNEALLAQFVYDRDPASLTEEDIQGLSAFAGPYPRCSTRSSGSCTTQASPCII